MQTVAAVPTKHDTFQPTSSGRQMCGTHVYICISTISYMHAIKSKLLFHNLQPLDEQASRTVFRQYHRLGEQVAVLQLDGLETKLLEACGGLPLALQVVGEQLAQVKPHDSDELDAQVVQAHWQVGLTGGTGSVVVLLLCSRYRQMCSLHLRQAAWNLHLSGQGSYERCPILQKA